MLLAETANAEIIGLLATVVASLAALASWRASHRAAQAAEKLTEIEQLRRWEDLRPDLQAWCWQLTDERAEMWVNFVGPAALDDIDELTVTIRDDNWDHTPRTAGGLSAEQVAAQVWAPWRFVPGVDGAGKNGRSVAAFPLRVGQARRLELERTPPPPEAPRSMWIEAYADDPLRVEFIARSGDHAPWRVTRDSDVTMR